MLLGVALTAGLLVVPAAADDDPRPTLRGGRDDAETASRGLDHLGNSRTPDGLRENSDLAFRDDLLVQGNYHGFATYDLADPAAPRLLSRVVCPGSQNDVTLHGDLLFVSVEASAARVDCTLDSTAERFRGVRVFDVSDPARPRQVAGVQTCRGSHTNTVVEAPGVTDRVWIYSSGIGSVRSDLDGCSTAGATGENPSRWRIEVIEVPLADPAAARVVSAPRLFEDGGRIDGLQNSPPTTNHPSGAAWSPRPVTDSCHDITVRADLGLAAAACAGNGLLLDVSDPAAPRRIDVVDDPNFSYWHSAIFNNDGTKVVFADEWGGGRAARCGPDDHPAWGGNAIYEIRDGRLVFASYVKLPVPQSSLENCVAHNGSIVPIEGRDVLVQAWYQGGISLVDFTDARRPYEIAWFDRGPVNPDTREFGGFWAAYWFNGYVYGSEIARGLDVFSLAATPQLTAAEIAAAERHRLPVFNPQSPPRFDLPPVPLAEPADEDAPDDGRRFSDVPANDTHAEAIERLAEAGILAGYDDGTFRPRRDMTRGQVALVVVRALEPPDSDDDGFSDVEGDGEQARAIRAAAAAGWIDGYDDGTFRPRATITRGQLASVLGRALDLEELADGPFPDVDGSGHEGMINAMYAAELASGFEDGTFRPRRPVVRAQVASLVDRALRARG